MIARVHLDEIIVSNPLDGPLPPEAADTIARWLLDLADRRQADQTAAAEQEDRADD